MDIHTLEYFKKTAELQHITQAADALHVAQPAQDGSRQNCRHGYCLSEPWHTLHLQCPVQAEQGKDCSCGEMQY